VNTWWRHQLYSGTATQPEEISRPYDVVCPQGLAMFLGEMGPTHYFSTIILGPTGVLFH